MKKVAAYTGSRNIYPQMVPAVVSLLEHADLDKVYLFIQDDEFPYRLPHQCQIRNVSNQKYFPPNGANMKSPFTYFAMMRAALPYELNEDRCLSLDVDTIVVDRIDQLWDLDLDGYYYAGVRTPHTFKRGAYFNAGVSMLNLDKLRDGTADRIIDLLNQRKFYFVDQEAYNQACKNKILELDPCYNCCIWTDWTDHPKIIHYGGMKEWDKYKDYVDYDRKAKQLGYVQKKTS